MVNDRNPIAADATGMISTAAEIASKIKLGWNLGNTLEATGSETAWGNPKVTKELIDLVKLNGFNAVRIPCSWNQYLSNAKTAEIKTDWLNRVKEVIQYCIDNEMYAILNIHWDGGWLENNVTEAKKVEVNAKQKAFYYVRVLEIPTPRWTLYDKVRLGAAPDASVPLIHQERAFSSPIWYTPK